MEDRHRRSEERIAHLERVVEELSDELLRQSRALALYDRRLRWLMERLAEPEEAAPPPAHQRPPHW